MKPDAEAQPDPGEAEQERWHVLTQLEEWLERPMVLLSFVWLCH